MTRGRLCGALLVLSVCMVLLSTAPVRAGTWMERLRGTMGAYSSSSRTILSEPPRERGERPVQRALDSLMPLFLSGMLVGLLLGLLGAHLWQVRYGRQRRQRDIDRLTEDFQALFRKSDERG